MKFKPKHERKFWCLADASGAPSKQLNDAIAEVARHLRSLPSSAGRVLLARQRKGVQRDRLVLRIENAPEGVRLLVNGDD